MHEVLHWKWLRGTTQTYPDDDERNDRYPILRGCSGPILLRDLPLALDISEGESATIDIAPPPSLPMGGRKERRRLSRVAAMAVSMDETNDRMYIQVLVPSSKILTMLVATAIFLHGCTWKHEIQGSASSLFAALARGAMSIAPGKASNT